MYKGEDKIVKVTLTDQDGAPINPSSFAGFIVEVYEQIGQPIAKYSLNVSAGYGTIDNINALAGTFEFNLQRSVVKKYLRKKIWGEIKTREVNANFEGGEFHSIAPPFEIDTLSDAATSNEIIP